METEFEKNLSEHESRFSNLGAQQAGLVLLVLAQRYRAAFELFEERSPLRSGEFQLWLLKLWKLAEAGTGGESLSEHIRASLPGEEWVVDGFHDAIAQYVGGLAIGAAESLDGSRAPEGHPENSGFETVRLILCQMILGCTEPGEDPESMEFEGTLHKRPMIVHEEELWKTLLGLVETGASLIALKEFASENSLGIGAVKQVLYKSLAKTQPQSSAG